MHNNCSFCDNEIEKICYCKECWDSLVSERDDLCIKVDDLEDKVDSLEDEIKDLKEELNDKH